MHFYNTILGLLMFFLVLPGNPEIVFIKQLNILVDVYEVKQVDFDVFWESIDSQYFKGSVIRGYFYDYQSEAWTLKDSTLSMESYNEKPAVLVTYDQACQYCKSKGGRLPSNKEWDFYSGKNIIKGNIWHGLFPYKDYGNDGFKATLAPVGYFETNDYGLYDIYGNAWEYTQLENNKLLLRGGSYLCDFSMCTNARRKGLQVFETNKAQENVGFRCVYDSYE